MRQLRNPVAIALLSCSLAFSFQVFALETEKTVKRESSPDGEKIVVLENGKAIKELTIKHIGKESTTYMVEKRVGDKTETKTISKSQEAVNDEIKQLMK